MSDHVTVSDLASWIRRPDLDPSDVAAQLAIDAAEGEVAAELALDSLAFVEDDPIAMMTRGSRIWLPGYPVSEIDVEIDGEALVLDTDYTLDDKLGILRRLPLGALWGLSWIEITYSHGFETLPPAVKGVVLGAAARMYSNPAGVTGEAGGGYSVNRGLDNPALGLTAGERMALEGVKR